MSDMISAISNTATNTTSSSSAIGNDELGKYEFLQLLVTQLKNQDPLSPLQSQEFAAQLAQFSSLERLMDIDDSLQSGMESDRVLVQAIQNTMATTFIGKEVLAYGSTIAHLSGESETLTLELMDEADTVQVKILDADGRIVRTIEARGLPAGRTDIEWDGLDDNGQVLPGGNYSLKVEAEDGDHNPVQVFTLTRGLISSIRYESGQPVMIVNGESLYFGDIVQIGG